MFKNMINLRNMFIKGGYINGTNSTRMHPIKNIKINSSNNWTRISIKVNNNNVGTICNIGNSVDIKINLNNNYDVALIANNKEYFKQKALYEFEVEIDTEDQSIIKIINDTIYDS